MTGFPVIQAIPVALHSLENISYDNFKIKQHLSEAIEWIKYAHIKAADGGISKGYDLIRARWASSYPETTGYTIPSLLNTAFFLHQPELESLAISLADYLIKYATPQGGVAHWQDNKTQLPIVFDTGQVIFGWLATFEARGDKCYLQAAIKAGNWLASVQDPTGAWNKFQHLGIPKVIDTRVAWALLKLYHHTDDLCHKNAAIQNLDWALQQQEVDGWFNHCAFTASEDPFTHTLAYTAEGLLECGQILEDERYISASQLTADALLTRQYEDGHLASTYKAGWHESSRSSCLTGNCQMARLWLSFYQTTQKAEYYTAAKKALTFVASTQNIKTANPNFRGAISGSYPIYGLYERFKYPNWASKFFIDALLTLESVNEKKDILIYAG